MFDFLIINPAKRLIAWIKSHPILAVLLFLAIWILPPIIIATITVANAITKVVKTIFGVSVAQKVFNAGYKAIQWLSGDTSKAATPRYYWIALLLFPFFPVPAFFLVLWNFLSPKKKGVYSAVLNDATTTNDNPPTSETYTIPGAPAPDLPLPDFANTGGFEL